VESERARERRERRFETLGERVFRERERGRRERGRGCVKLDLNTKGNLSVLKLGVILCYKPRLLSGSHFAGLFWFLK